MHVMFFFENVSYLLNKLRNKVHMVIMMETMYG